MLRQSSTLRNQRDSPLLRLPAELRNSIYIYILGGHTVELCYAQRCLTCDNRGLSTGAFPIWHHPGSNLFLLEASYQIYTETRLLPFSSNVFIGTPKDVANFPKHTLQDHQAKAIRAIGLQYDGVDIDHMHPERLGKEVVAALSTLAADQGLRKIVLLWYNEPRDASRQALRETIHQAVDKELKLFTDRHDVATGSLVTSYNDFDSLSRREGARNEQTLTRAFGNVRTLNTGDCIEPPVLGVQSTFSRWKY